MSEHTLKRGAPRRGRVGLRTSGPLLLLAAAILVSVASTHVAAPKLSPISSVTGLSVSGTNLVDASGNVVQLRGVNRSGTEYACVQGWGIFDGPSDLASVQAIASWHVNAVRVPLNEDCWLGINGVSTSYSGSAYQQAIANYVSLLNQNGLYAILELHWSAPGTTTATGQNPMPDQDHSPTFWSSVANRFKSNKSVIFDLFNEPYPDSNGDTAAAWSCWKNGGTCAGVSYSAAGMQELVNTVRATGATNVVMLGGVQYAGSLDQWHNNAPADPAGQLAASFHTYNFTSCTNATCWNSWLAAIGSVPLVTGEIGETDGAATYINSYMSWADAHGASYMAWVWNTWGCGGSIALITDYSGTPCQSYGSGYKQHVTQTAPSPTTSTTAAPTTTTAPTTSTTSAPTTTTPPPTTTPSTTTPPRSSLVLDRSVSADRGPATNLVSSALTTSGSNELLVAFLSTDGPGPGSPQSFTKVSGGGLTWTRAVASNRQPGAAEVWTAFAPAPVSNLTVTAVRQAGGYEGSVTLAAFKGASSTIGAVASGSAASGGPAVSLTTMGSGSLVWGVGHDWDNGLARTVGSGQTLVHQYVDTSIGDTSWVQGRSALTGSAGTVATISDSGPTADQWNLAAIEIRAV